MRSSRAAKCSNHLQADPARPEQGRPALRTLRAHGPVRGSTVFPVGKACGNPAECDRLAKVLVLSASAPAA